MKRLQLLSVFLSLFLVGCTVYHPIAPIVAAPCSSVHTQKSAVLMLKSGAMTTQDGEAYYGSAGAGLIENIVAAGIESKIAKKQIVYFGLQDQFVFMKSLKSYLVKNKIFKQVEFANKKLNDPTKVYITVDFNATRVGETDERYPVTLDVTLNISKGHQLFERHFFIHDDAKKSSNFNGNDFMFHSTDAANRVFVDVVKSINLWVKKNNKF